MKKIILFGILLLTSFSGRTQILYQESFDNIPGPTAGGMGTYTFPPNFIRCNVDNLTPNVTHAFINEAWVRTEDPDFPSDTVIVSTSFYNPPGIANDFIWTPPIVLGSGSNLLSWNARAYEFDTLYADGYEVRIMTNTPTGGTGIIGNQLSNSTLLMSIPIENHTWTSRSVNLTPYAGQTVYVGFRNNSNDKNMLYIDDIKVETINDYDAALTNAFIQYTSLPLGQGIPLSATVSNFGGMPLTNVALQCEVLNILFQTIHTDTSVSIPSLAPLANQTFTLPEYFPTSTGLFFVRYTPVHTEIDGNPANNQMIKTIPVDVSIFARDFDVAAGGMGVSDSLAFVPGGALGNIFKLVAPAYLHSITTHYTQGGWYSSSWTTKYASGVWNTDANGTPTTFIASTDTLSYTNNSSLTATVPIHGGPLLLPAGTYFVGAMEVDFIMTLGYTSSLYTSGKHWGYAPSLGWLDFDLIGWTSNVPMVRMNLLPSPFPLPNQALVLNGKTTLTQHQLSWSRQESDKNQYTYILQRSEDLRNWKEVYTETVSGNNACRTMGYTDAIDGNPKSYYRVSVKTQDNQQEYSNTLTLYGNKEKIKVELYPNPAKGQITIQSNLSKSSTFQIYDGEGKLRLSKTINPSRTVFQLGELPPGVYQVRLVSGQEIVYADKLILE